MGVCCSSHPTSSVTTVMEEGAKDAPQGGQESQEIPSSTALSEPTVCPITPSNASESDTDTAVSMPFASGSISGVGAEEQCDRDSGSDELASDTHSSTYVRIRGRRGSVSGETDLSDLSGAMWWQQTPHRSGVLRGADADSPGEGALIRKVLCAHPLFALCSQDVFTLQEVAEAFQRHETQPGEVIVSPGDEDAFHVVVQSKAVADLGDGDAATASETAQRQEWAVGHYFGSEGLLYPLYPGDEGAAVRAAGLLDAPVPTVTWGLNRTCYQQLMRIIHNTALYELIKWISQSPLFQHLSRAQIRRLCERAAMVARDPSAHVLQTGEVPTDLLFLISGIVALEQEQGCGGGHSGQTCVPPAALGAGDCVGDAELMPVRYAAGEDANTTASERLTVMASRYTYVVVQAVRAIRIPIEDALAVLSWQDLQHMRERSRNVQEVERRQRQAEDALQHPEEPCFLTSVTDDGKDALELQRGHVNAALPLSGQLLDESAQDVYVKGARATAFFLEQIFPRQTYRRADGRERGLSMATFAPRKRYPAATVLFHVECSAGDEGAMHVSGEFSQSGGENGVASTADTSASAAPSEAPGCLYAVVSGQITLMNRDTGEEIYRVSRGNTLGEELLLPPLISPPGCFSTTTPLRTCAVVSSPNGCEMFELSRPAFREFLQRPYCDALQDWCGMFCVFLFSEYLPELYWRYLFSCTTERVACGGDLVGVRGAPCKWVSLIFDGRIGAYVRGSVEDGGVTQQEGEEVLVASFGVGDIVGGQEVMERRPSSVAYVCKHRAHMLCVPAESFSGLFRPALPYLQRLWSSERYQKVMTVPATEGCLT
ncbi:hypothetical protein LSCM1_01350 [Leishmania martiniquensis]|uniref:Cyclic nucleotide-binding domain-containing protein n=1 Tax=Leishmania martiniquensis TaxID=1580590 RepID=A0A836KFY3_9TRYP|nr:hypothetical protein LSCM1_01350 [Leishmania martiniquensis]